MNKINVAIGTDILAPKLQLASTDLESFYKGISEVKHIADKKEQKFFCCTRDWKIAYRKKENLKENPKFDFIVIDGDHGDKEKPHLSSEKEVHTYLKGEKLNHFIISTYSKTADNNKWRCVILTTDVDSLNIESTVRTIVNNMNSAGLSVGYAIENHDLSRAWFYGAMANPELLKKYAYLKGASYIGGKPASTSIKEKVDNVIASPTKQTKPEMTRILRTGDSPYHYTQLKYASMQVKDGVDKQTTLDVLRKYMLDWEESTPRWEEYYKDLFRLVSYAYDSSEAKIKPSTPSVIVSKPKVVIPATTAGCEFKRPPGIVGEIVDEYLKTMRYPEPSIAVVGVLHSLGVMAGNFYNCEGLGLSQKRILLAGSGEGKNSVTDWLNYLTHRLQKEFPDLEGQLNSIHGNPNYTSGKMLHQSLQRFPVRSIITAEAGKTMKSKAGDVDKIQGIFLTILGNKYRGVLRPQGMAQIGKEVPMLPLYNLNVQILAESVPDSYIESMLDNDDIASGDLSRSELVFIETSNIKNTINFKNTDYKVSDAVINVYKKLFSDFYTQGNSEPTLYQYNSVKVSLDADVEAEYQKLETEKLGICRKKDQDVFTIALYTRLHEKTLKTALLLAIAEGSVTINLEQWNWAYEYQQEILETVKNQQQKGKFKSRFVVLGEKLLAKGANLPFSKEYIRLVPNTEARKDFIVNGSVLKSFIYRYTAFQSLVSNVYRGKESEAIQGFLNYCLNTEILQKEDGTKYEMKNPIYKLNMGV